MLGRPLYTVGHPLRSTLRTNIREYTAKLLAFTMMVIIGLWMYHDEARQRHKQPKENPQQIIFLEWEGGNRASSPSENYESHYSRCAGLVLCNLQVPDGGWGAAISCMAVGVEWAPDPLPAKLDLRHELLTEPERRLITSGHTTGIWQPIVIATTQGSSAHDLTFIGDSASDLILLLLLLLFHHNICA